MSLKAEYRPFVGLVHDGSCCKCPPETVLVIGATSDHFVCSECLAKYPMAIVSMVGAPTVIKAKDKGLSLAAQSALIDGSARSQAIAWYYKQGSKLRFRNSQTFEVDPPE